MQRRLLALLCLTVLVLSGCNTLRGTSDSAYAYKPGYIPINTQAVELSHPNKTQEDILAALPDEIVQLSI